MRRAVVVAAVIAIQAAILPVWAAEPLLGMWHLDRQEIDGKDTNPEPLTLKVSQSGDRLVFAFSVPVNNVYFVAMTYTLKLDGLEADVKNGQGDKVGTIQMTPGGPLAQALQRLTQQGLLQRMTLSGLLDDDVAELSRSLTGRELSAELVYAIRTEAAGNPFFVQEIVRHLSESDRSGGVLSLARAGLPESVREVIDLRLAPLEEACVRLLIVAAVIGGEFELEPLERISDLEGEDLAASLDEALAAGLVLELAPSDRERFAFSHALVRRTLLERLSRAHRRRIHGRVAEALEASRGEAALSEIAYHLCEATPTVDREHALDYATRAAEQATARLAYAEAVDLFTRALSLLPPEHERRRILALKRALAYQALWHAIADTPRPETRGDPIAPSPAPNSDQSLTSSGVMSPTIS